MTRLLNLGLRGKLVVLTTVGIIAAFLAIGVFRLYDARNTITTDIQRSGKERAGLIAEALANLVVGYDYTNMESLADRIVQQEDVQSIVIRNRNDKVMVSRNSSLIPGAETMHVTAPIIFAGERVGSVDLQLSLLRMENKISMTYRSIVIEQLFFAVFLGIIIYLATSRVILKPIGRVKNTMNAVISNPDGAPPQKLETGSMDEIGELTGIFNDMNQKIYEAHQRLQEKVHLADSALIATNAELKVRSAELEERTKELEKALELAGTLAVTDSLTSLPNRRYFDVHLTSNFLRAKRYGERLSLILLDVDNFKHINDGPNLGHAAGDYVLQELGGIFRSRTRESDVSARLGGDEFAFLLNHASAVEAVSVAQTLADMTKAHEFVFQGQRISVTLSLGVVQISQEFEHTESMYAAADKALYEAKHRGRNQIVMYPFPARAEVG